MGVESMAEVVGQEIMGEVDLKGTFHHKSY
jgi:hypothetical protein